MTDKPIRKTQARVVERERTRAQQERKNAMKTAIPLIIALVVIVYVVFVVFTTANQATVQGTIGPRLQVDREQIDLGHREFNETVRAAFTIKNVGDGTLNLTVPRVAEALEGC